MKLYSKKIIDEHTREITLVGVPFLCKKNYLTEKKQVAYKFIYKKLSFTLTKNIKLRRKSRTVPKDNGRSDALIYLKCIRNLFEKIETVETIIVGSSTMRVGYIENKKAINFGIDAQDLYYSYMILDKYVKTIPNLKNVVLGFDPFSLGNDLDKHPQAYRQCFYKSYMDIPYKNKLNIIQKDLIKFEKKVLNFRKYIDKNLPDIPRNCMSSYSTGNIAEAELIRLVERELKLSTKDTMLHYLKNIIQICDDNNLNLHIVLMPRNPIVKKYYPATNILYASLFDLVKNHEWIKVHNAFDELMLTKDDFLDLLHMTCKGSEKFSEYLNNQVGINQ